MRLRHAVLAVALVLITVQASAQAQQGLQLEEKIPLGAVRGRIDHMAIDLVRQRLFVADLGTNLVYEVPLSGSIKTIGSGFNQPRGVAVDAAGDVFVADFGNNAVKEVLPGGTIKTIGSGFNGPDGVAVDAGGDVFVADFNNNAVKEVLLNGTIKTIGSGFTQPRDVAVDAAGDVFVADNNNNRVVEVETRLIYGSQAGLKRALKNSAVSDSVNTVFVERQNGTDRNRNARKVRKTYCFSKDWDVHEAVTYFTTYSANFCWPVRTLRQGRRHAGYQQRTPAMAAGLADHVWSLREWLTFPSVKRTRATSPGG